MSYESADLVRRAAAVADIALYIKDQIADLVRLRALVSAAELRRALRPTRLVTEDSVTRGHAGAIRLVVKPPAETYRPRAKRRNR